VLALKRRFPAIAEPKKADILYATQNRQDAVKFMAPRVELGGGDRQPDQFEFRTACASCRTIRCAGRTW